MLEELERRNYAPGTIRCYIHVVEQFARHFHRPPDQLGLEHIRQYQASLLRQKKLAPSTVAQHLAVLRFFYIQVLKRSWSAAETPVSATGPRPAAGAQPRRSRTFDPGVPDTLSECRAHDTLCDRRPPRRGGHAQGQRY